LKTTSPAGIHRFKLYSTGEYPGGGTAPKLYSWPPIQTKMIFELIEGSSSSALAMLVRAAPQRTYSGFSGVHFLASAMDLQ